MDFFKLYRTYCGFSMSSRSMPKNLMPGIIFSSTPSILGIGRATDKSSFYVLLKKRENNDFFVVCDNVFALDHSFNFFSSKFALVNRVS